MDDIVPTFEIINNIPQGVFWKDVNLVYLGCNKQFAEAAGLHSPEEIIGKTDYELPWEPAQTEHYRKIDRQVLRNGEGIYNLVESLTASDGSLRWNRVDKVPLFDREKNIIGVLGTYQDISEKVHSIALIHEMLYGSSDLSTIGFHTYLRELVQGIVRTMGSRAKGITYRIEADPIYLDIDKSVPLGLIVNESVSNSYKHAFLKTGKGHIDIELKKTDSGLTFIVKDNGSGFPEEKITQTDTLGLQLLRTLACQLKGEIGIISRDGTEVRIELPL